ncbi:hypothetical protein OC846_003765 [Tilletia horrida]|uniref:Uncharacterized protein n=1 Tax=Tilletia horrida TaxID=155126 RepID=A0AAN6JTK6_9BASI|nr:hypothetical protein OC845_005254 [Tilletia horrida]KAK0550215.1 hypothetical protein OC846_003765 [Tilletia horrida]
MSHPQPGHTEPTEPHKDPLASHELGEVFNEAKQRSEWFPKLQSIADHAGSTSTPADVTQAIKDLQTHFFEAQASVQLSQSLQGLKGPEAFSKGANLDYEQAIEAAKHQLMSAHYDRTLASRTALRLVTGILVPEQIKVNDSISKLVFDTVGEVAINAERITNLGGLETIVDSRQSLAGKDLKALKAAVEAQQSLMLLKTQVATAQYDLIADFVTRPDAHLWWSLGNLVPTLQPKSNLETTLACVQAIYDCTPQSSEPLVFSELSKLNGSFYTTALAHWQKETKARGQEDPASLSPEEKRKIIAGSVKEVMDGFSWEGAAWLQKKLKGRHYVAISLMAMIGKGAIHFSLEPTKKPIGP